MGERFVDMWAGFRPDSLTRRSIVWLERLSMGAVVGGGGGSGFGAVGNRREAAGSCFGVAGILAAVAGAGSARVEIAATAASVSDEA